MWLCYLSPAFHYYCSIHWEKWTVFFHVHVRMSHGKCFERRNKKTTVTNRRIIQWLRTVGCQCGAISLHLTIYLMDFKQFQNVLLFCRFCYFFSIKNGRWKRRVPLRTISFIYHNSFFIRFLWLHWKNFGGKIEIKFWINWIEFSF